MKTSHDPKTWADRALCRTERIPVDYFYLETGDTYQATIVRRYCQRCPVKNQCLQTALDAHDPNGIWGGQTPNERRRTTRAQKAPTS